MFLIYHRGLALCREIKKPVSIFGYSLGMMSYLSAEPDKCPLISLRRQKADDLCESVTRSWSLSPFGSPTTRTEIGSDGEAENGGHSSQLSALVLHCLISLAFTAVRRGMWCSSLLAVRQIMVRLLLGDSQTVKLPPVSDFAYLSY